MASESSGICGSLFLAGFGSGPGSSWHGTSSDSSGLFGVKSDASCLLRVLINLIFAFRLIDELVTTTELRVMEPSPLP